MLHSNDKLIKALRMLLGFVLLVFSLNGFFGFLPMPAPPTAASEFLQSMDRAGFVFPLLYGVEILLGVMLLFNLYSALAILGFVPIALNILLYHLFLDPAGGLVGYITVLVEILLLTAYFSYYKNLFNLRP
jgi:hypothetical protein